MKYIFIITIILTIILSGCSNIEEPANPTMKGTTHITTDKGLDCVVYKFTGPNKGGAGISCNWQKFNSQTSQL